MANQELVQVCESLISSNRDYSESHISILLSMERVLPLTTDLSGLEIIDPDEVDSDDEVAEAQQNLLDEVSTICEAVITDQEIRESVLLHISNAASRSRSVTPSRLLAALTSPEDTLEQELDEGKINILSMHRAKGLSARAVIIVAAEEQLIPGDVAGDEYDDARRLLYVSLTRAEEYLCISYCNERTGRQRHSGSDPGVARRSLSPFLRGALPIEGGNEYLERIRTV